MPTDRLHFGLANDPGNLGWMTSSGVPWRYRYQYLSGGVNTGSGWETWNAPAGAFATYYMNASLSAGYIPVFSYYELLQSSPSIGSNELDRDYSNLNNASTMNAYYGNFALLMQKAKAFGQLVVVHVEPDLFGYMEQKAAGGDATTVSASVASSAYPGLGSFPNTFQGFASALLSLRNAIAPNVLLADHASTWASGVDIALNTDTTLNMAADADKVGNFLNSAGNFDLIFNDVADHDAGYSGRWWDRYDVTLPDFAQWLAWMTELRAKTGKQLIVWQVPVGNQYFRTMNNTNGHYQDNRAEYFLSHTSALTAAGIIAVLFGKANAYQTNYIDELGDGVTNPMPVTSFECSGCNTNTSVWPDDDGGYLRIFVGQYYATTTPAQRGPYVPLAPSRILDTRIGGSPLGPDASMNVQVTGAGGVPATGVSAVVMNVTVTNTTTSSYLTVWPAGAFRPTASSLNWVAGQTVPNLVEVALGTNGQVSVYNPLGRTDIVIDVEGYVPVQSGPPGPAGLFNPLTPARVLDTRLSSGPIGAMQSINLTMGGAGGVPGAGVSAVVLNVTATGATAPSYVTVFPTGSAVPTASNLNFSAGQTVPNRVIVKLGTGGSVSFFNRFGSVDVVADVAGWFTDVASAAGGSMFAGVTPSRILDSRFGQPIGPNSTMVLRVAGNGGVPAMNATIAPAAVVINVTVTNPTAPSYLTVWPDGASRSLTSDLNYVAGKTVPNLTVVKLGPNGAIDLYNLAGTTDVIVDVVGWYG